MPKPRGPRAAPGSADGPFRAYLAEDWRRWMQEAPEVATTVGFPGVNDRWTDDSPKGIAARQRHLEESARRLARIDPKRLSPSERLSYRLYDDLLRTALAGRRFGDDPLPFHFGIPRNLWMPLSQMDGLHISAGQLLGIQPRRTEADVEAIVARLAALPTAVDQLLALLEEGRARGVTPPQAALRGVPAQVAGLLTDEPGASPMLQPFRERPAGVAPAAFDRLAEAARESYRRRARPAFEKLHRYLVESYLPGARTTIAVADLPDGRAAYAHHVRWVTTTDLTPEQIHAIGLEEVRRTRAEIETLVRSTGFTGTVGEFHRWLRSETRFRPRSAPEYVDAYRVLAKRIDPELARHFGRLPRLPYGVQPVPDFQAPSVPAAYYIVGSLADGRPGVFYANTHDLAARPTWRMESMTLHEAVPGHHLQMAIAGELEGLPEFRHHSAETAFVEGWGLYAETLGEELGLYQDPYARFGQLDHDIWRSIRLVVDTGMHALGWSRERAIEFFRENTGMSDLDIQVEVDRYLVMPAQALAYKIGQLKFLELRRLAERTLGDRFDERAFHDVVLGEGGLPLGEVDARVRAWIDAQGPPARGRPARTRRPTPRRRAPGRRRR